METFYTAIPLGTSLGRSLYEIKRNFIKRYIIDGEVEDVSQFNFPDRKPAFLNFKNLFGNSIDIFYKEIGRLYNPEIQEENALFSLEEFCKNNFQSKKKFYLLRLKSSYNVAVKIKLNQDGIFYKHLGDIEEDYTPFEDNLKMELQSKYDFYSDIVKGIWMENHRIPKKDTKSWEIRKSAIKIIKKIEKIAKEKKFNLD